MLHKSINAAAKVFADGESEDTVARCAALQAQLFAIKDDIVDCTGEALDPDEQRVALNKQIAALDAYHAGVQAYIQTKQCEATPTPCLRCFVTDKKYLVGQRGQRRSGYLDFKNGSDGVIHCDYCGVEVHG